MNTKRGTALNASADADGRDAKREKIIRTQLLTVTSEQWQELKNGHSTTLTHTHGKQTAPLERVLLKILKPNPVAPPNATPTTTTATASGATDAKQSAAVNANDQSGTSHAAASVAQKATKDAKDRGVSGAAQKEEEEALTVYHGEIVAKRAAAATSQIGAGIRLRLVKSGSGGNDVGAKKAAEKRDDGDRDGGDSEGDGKDGVLELVLGDEVTNVGIEGVLGLEGLLPADWRAVLVQEFGKAYWWKLIEFLVDKDRQGRTIYPRVGDIFAAFHHCPLANVRACILGQDPYHSPGQAHGLSFSVPTGVAVPSSLGNIYTELKNDIKRAPGGSRSSGNLVGWAAQGILLLNTALTVTHQQPASHSNSGWHTFTAAVLHALNTAKHNLVFFAWGKHAQSKTTLINTQRHLVLKAPHPSGLSAHTGFFGCRHFSKANSYLEHHNLDPISW